MLDWQGLEITKGLMSGYEICVYLIYDHSRNWHSLSIYDVLDTVLGAFYESVFKQTVILGSRYYYCHYHF